MGILSIFNKQTQEPKTEVIKPFGSSLQSFALSTNGLEYGNNVSKTSNGYIQDDGFYSYKLIHLYYQSPLHSAVIDFKKLLSVGNGFTIDGATNLTMADKISLNQLTNGYEEDLNHIGMDYFLHNRVCLEVTWNADFTKIVKVERLNPASVRIFAVNEKMQPTAYSYNYDWINVFKYKTKIYAAFSEYNKKDRTQLYMWQGESPSQNLYNLPSYASAINWITVDSESSEYHKANINNSINPSMLIQYFEKPSTTEEKQQVLFDLNQSFAGARKTGRAMVTFSDSKELAPSVTQMPANQLDKTFIQLTDTVNRQVCYAHRLDPQLLGLKTPGSLGNSGELEYAYNIFNAQVIQPAQRDIEKILNKFIKINGLGVVLKLNEPTMVQVKVEETKMSEDTGDDLTTDGQPLAVNDAVKNLSAKQHQQLLRIIRQYGKDQINYAAASVLLRTSLGLAEEDIDLILGEI
jgi:hypothetical protein